MSITAYTGLPGSGKTYGVVQHVIVPALQAGRRVVTNVPMRADVVASRGWPGELVRVTSEQIASDGWFDSVPGGAVVVLDELWRVWPAGLKTVNVPTSHKSFLAEHRHRVGEDGYSMEVCLVTQDLAQIAAFARQLVEQTVRVTKLAAVGAEKRFRVDFFEGSHTGQHPPEARRLRQVFGAYSAEVWELYQSHTQSSTGAAGREVRTDSRGSALRSATIRLGVPLGIAALVLGAVGAFRSLREPVPVASGRSATASVPVAAGPGVRAGFQSAPGASSAPSFVSPSAGRPVALIGWRLAGRLQWSGRPDTAALVLVSDAGDVRTVRASEADCEPVPGSFTGDLRCVIDGEVVSPWTGDSAARSLGWQGGDGSGANNARPAAGHVAPASGAGA